MAAVNLPFSPLLPLILFLSSQTNYTYAFSFATGAGDAKRSKTASQDLVRSSCVHASYPNICLRTLSSFDGAVNTPKDVAQASVQVSLSRARKTSAYLAATLRLGNSTGSSKREQAALRDCLNQVSDSVDELSKTLSELQHLRSGRFRWQMNNAETWVSAALTNEDTCLDGLQDSNGNGKVRFDVKRRITNVARVTSNALYLINLFDHTRES
ncbi:hypothetical protein U1Q18_028828 [Sarracenia purpurea var. burkii]